MSLKLLDISFAPKNEFCPNQPPFILNVAFDVEDNGLPQRVTDESRELVHGPLSEVVAKWRESDPYQAKAVRLARDLATAVERLAILEANVGRLRVSVEAALFDLRDPAPIEERLAAATAEADLLRSRKVMLERLTADTRKAAADSLRKAVTEAVAKLRKEAEAKLDACREQLSAEIGDAVLSALKVKYLAGMSVQSGLADYFVGPATA